ncbi:ABC transporter permease [Flavitalea sp. BT771]|uniref:ABC transporter permease n=1 Tax=Flavitalea sp. BT771 TaxID=3063329 RepID=UPI0026E34B54|nr:ABC transporter permease [Flavitalea sp. BT771]MDO6435614.1 ABC transporter permease [Flavitalea sp. BT771]MDV6224514.1 ABC transporter permease [Flavitalea sp. BT771]
MANHLRTAWRHLKREKGFTAMTVFGLALGLTACIFITLFVVNELAYDRYNANADRIFRIASDLHINGGSINDVATPPAMAAALIRDFPSVANAVRIRAVQKNVAVHVGGKVFSEPGVMLADASLFSVFTLPMMDGDPRTVLSAPNAVVLSATLAKRYFNTTEAVGQTLRFDQDTAVYVVTGVIRDMPAASHIHFQLIRSLQQKKEEWINLFAATYVLVRPGIRAADIDGMLAQTVEKYVDPQIHEQLHNSAADLRRNGDHFRYYCMPLTRIHLYSNLGHEFEPNGSIQYVVLLMVVAVLILVVACINFVNLSIARSLRRLREIGVKKVLGSGRRRLVAQFLVESVCMAGIAMGVAVFLVVILLPFFDQLAGKSFTASILLSPWMVPAFLLATGLVGLVSGAYPALALSRIAPLHILRGHTTLGSRTTILRTVLLVFQFSVAMVLMIGTGVIYSQLSYIRRHDLGYTRQQVVTIKDTRTLGDQVWTFANEAKNLPGVVSATVSGSLPHQKVVYRGFFKDRSASVTSTALLGDWQIDADYLRTLDMKLVIGRNFSPQLPTDSACALINETAARVLGYAWPLGEKIYTGTDSASGFRIIGVVKDFNTGSLRDPIDPVVFRLGRDGSAVTFRLSHLNMTGTLKAIRSRYEEVANGHPFIYSFLDEDFHRLYEADQRTGSLFTLFSGLAIIIAGLGMFGLVSAATEQRTKELGIRRILGARAADLALLLLKDYVPAIGLAIAIALPVGAWVSHSWLQGFAYRTQLQPWILVAAPLSAVGIAVLIVGMKASRAAWLNVTDALRME